MNTPQKPMLAGDAPPADQLRFPLLVSPKLDGIRATYWGGQMYSRSLKLIPNNHTQILAKMANLPAAFDGELVVGDPWGEGVFNRTTSGMMSIQGEPRFTWWVFDYVPTNEKDRHGFLGRYNRLATNTTAIQSFNPWIKILEHRMVHTVEELIAAEQHCLNQGFEGLMARDPHGPYKHGRSTVREGYLLKIKRFADSEALVVGFEEEMQNTNEATTNELGNTKRSTHAAGMVGKGTLGALLCKTKEGIEFSLGGGFTQAQRAELWAVRGTLPGRIAKYKHFEVGVKDKPRFPVWLGFRDPRDMS